MGFHSKQSVAHEYLQDNTLNNLMELPKIAADFTSPDTWSTTDDLYAVLGAIFYVVVSGVDKTHCGRESNNT